jgi:hypothetical protein
MVSPRYHLVKAHSTAEKVFFRYGNPLFRSEKPLDRCVNPLFSLGKRLHRCVFRFFTA